MKQIFDTEDACRFLKCHRNTIHNYVSRGLLKPCISGYNLYFKIKDLKKIQRPAADGPKKGGEKR